MMKPIILAALVAAATASCPNDCSGHGACNTYSACECMRNWMGADCSERVCQFSRSFVDTPQGDLNADGFVDRGNIKTVLLGATESFWGKEDGSTCDGTGCTCIGPCVKYTTTTAFTTIFGESNFVGTFQGADATASQVAWVSDGSAYAGDSSRANVATAYATGAGATFADGAAYLVGSCGTESWARKASAIVTNTITVATTPASCNAANAYTGTSGTIQKVVTSTLASPIYPADEYSATNSDIYGFVASCQALHGSAYDHVIKVEVDDAFNDWPSSNNNKAFMAVPTWTPDGVDKVGATGKVNPFVGAESDGTTTGAQMVVCAVSATTYSAQWSPRREWELYPDQHGKGAPAGTATATYDEAHFYKECAGKGTCDRSSGECECYPGFEGTGCLRASCPEDCSGHGFCKRIADVTDTYLGWDAFNSQYCVCEPGYEGADCSLRTCPKGHDPIHRGMFNEIQTITLKDHWRLQGPGDHGSDAAMALVFTDEFGDEWATESFLIKPKGTRATVCDNDAAATDRSAKHLTAPLVDYGDGSGVSVTTTNAGGPNTVYCTQALGLVGGVASGAAPALTMISGGSGYDPSNPPLVRLKAAGTGYECSASGGEFPTAIVNEAGQVSGIDFTGITCTGVAFAVNWLEIEDPPHPGTWFSYTEGAKNMARALENLPNNVVPAVTISVQNDTPPNVAFSGADLLASGTAGTSNIIPTTTNNVNFRITFTDNSGDIPMLQVRFGNPVTRGVVPASGTAPSAAVLAKVPQAWIHTAGTSGDIGASVPRWSCAGVGADGQNRATADATGNACSGTGGWVSDLLTIAETTKGTKYNDVCSRRGICDYSSGECKCFAGFTDIDCHVQNALAMG